MSSLFVKSLLKDIAVNYELSTVKNNKRVVLGTFTDKKDAFKHAYIIIEANQGITIRKIKAVK